MTQTNETLATTPPAVPDLAAESATGAADLAVVLALIAAAGYYLYRKLWRNRGTCGSCGGKRGRCAVSAGETRVPLERIEREK